MMPQNNHSELVVKALYQLTERPSHFLRVMERILCCTGMFKPLIVQMHSKYRIRF